MSVTEIQQYIKDLKESIAGQGEVMIIPTIENYGLSGQNTTCVTVLGIDVYFSYKTAIAFRINGRLVVRENVWGVTTGKHLNLIDDGKKDDRVSGEEFKTLWNELAVNC